ncbi:hypothetical protein [Vibrio sp. SCSIO 43137]|uniref:hypothetical protein n=1 Tax=Vibrio sp. SCSIO 43137 TaxID=3021011 RepID=UPI002306E14F|nr:hypothetical protein [Vibrio sp. SCSIO 43137]WCE28423.1 hypothetical protein PK654_08535 [Vibrio sp. SCSIO 43137]
MCGGSSPKAPAPPPPPAPPPVKPAEVDTDGIDKKNSRQRKKAQRRGGDSTRRDLKINTSSSGSGLAVGGK